MSSEHVEKEKIPWTFLIPLMALLGFLGELWNITNPGGIAFTSYASLGIVVICYSALTSLPFISFYFAGVLGRLNFFKKRVNPTMMTWIYALTLCLSFYLGGPNSWGPCTSYGVPMGFRFIATPEEAERLLPWFMAPPADVAKKILYGGVPTPWIDLMPMIIFWWIFTVIYGVLMLSIATLFRKSWIDIERVPFPHTLAAYELLVRMMPEKKVRRGIERLTSPFMIGLILGIVLWIPTVCTALFPWFPDVFGWRVNTCSYGSYYVQPGEPLASLIGMARIGKEPLGVAIAYFAPLHILFNIWFWYLVLLILSQIAYYFGYYTGTINTPGCGRVWCGEVSLSYGEPFKWTAVLIGGIWGLTIFLLAINWRYIRDTLRVAFGRMNPSAKAEFEKDEPLSYRSTYVLLIGLFIAAVVICMVSGINPISAILTPINMIVLWLASMRFIGLAGIYYRKTDKGYALHRLLLWPRAPEVPDRDFVLSAHFNTWFTDAPDTGFMIGGNFLSAFEAYKLSSLTGVNSKSVFKVLLTSIIVYSLVVMLAYLHAVYTFGVTKLPGNDGVTCNGFIQRSASPEKWNTMPGTEPWAPHFVAGFIFVGFLSWLHARYVWFPFNPEGFILGIGAGFEWGFWSLALVAWILKMLTLKIGGSKAYEEIGAPLAGGYIAGHMLTIIPGTIISKIRFFYPF
jgi:hypothetical protein